MEIITCQRFENKCLGESTEFDESHVILEKLKLNYSLLEAGRNSKLIATKVKLGGVKANRGNRVNYSSVKLIKASTVSIITYPIPVYFQIHMFI